MKISVKVIKNYDNQEVGCVVMSTPNKNYFFNMPETFQRFSKSNMVRTSDSNVILFTRLCTSHICGIFGQMFDMYDTNQAIGSLIIGPKGTTDFFNSIRFKMGYKMLAFSFIDADHTNDFLYGFKKEETIKSLVKLHNYSAVFHNMNNYIEATFKSNEKIFNEEIINPNNFINKDHLFSDNSCVIHPIMQRGNVMSYVVIPEKIPGKVLKDKLDQFGIKGKMIAELLKNGQVTLSDGRVILSSQVSEQSSPSQILILIECDNEDHLLDLINNDYLTELIQSNIHKKDLIIACIVHLSPYEMVTKDTYQNYFSQFGEECQHIFTCQELYEEGQNQEDQISYNFSSSSLTSTLHQTFPNNFPAIMAATKMQKFTEMTTNTINTTNSLTKMANSPTKMTNSPKKMPNSPKKMINNTMKMTNSPTEMTNSSTKMIDGPMKMTNNPMKMTNSPIEMTNNPNKMANSPTEMANNPTKMTNNSLKITNNPLKMTNNPMKMTNNPMKMTNSPTETTQTNLTLPYSEV